MINYVSIHLRSHINALVFSPLFSSVWISRWNTSSSLFSYYLINSLSLLAKNVLVKHCLYNEVSCKEYSAVNMAMTTLVVFFLQSVKTAPTLPAKTSSNSRNDESSAKCVDHNVHKNPRTFSCELPDEKFFETL